MTNNALTLPASASPPAKVGAAKQKDLFIILKDDHNFDIIKEILDHRDQIIRAKKIRPIEKHRLVQNYNLTLLSYCMPKQKVIEDNSKDRGRPINFQINLGGEPTKSKRAKKAVKGGVNITIPATKGKDGTYAVSSGLESDLDD